MMKKKCPEGAKKMVDSIFPQADDFSWNTAYK